MLWLQTIHTIIVNIHTILFSYWATLSRTLSLGPIYSRTFIQIFKFDWKFIFVLLHFYFRRSDLYQFAHGPLTRYEKLRVAHAPGMPGTFFPLLRISDPNMHHGTCVTHVPWCMPGSLTSGFLWSQWRGKRSQYSRRMRNTQFYVSGKRPMPRHHRCHVMCKNWKIWLLWNWENSKRKCDKITVSMTISLVSWVPALVTPLAPFTHSPRHSTLARTHWFYAV